MRGYDEGGLPMQDSFASRLDEWLAGNWPDVRGLVTGASSGGIPLPDLLGSSAIPECLKQFAYRYPGGDRRAVASLWGQWFVGLTWPPLVAGVHALGALPDPPRARLLLEAPGRPAGLALTGGASEGPVPVLLERLVRDHGAPLIATVAATGRFSPRVLWCHAGAVLQWTLDQLDERCPGMSRAARRALLETTRWPDGSVNPLANSFSRVRGSAGLRRRVCCLRYRLDGFPCCGDCPVLPSGSASSRRVAGCHSE